MRDRPPLADQRVMIVEDSFLEAQAACDIVQRHGGYVVGPHPTTHQALMSAIENRPTLALLDVDLDGKMSFLLADALSSLGVPLAFFSGYDRAMAPERFKSSTWISKPATDEAVLSGLEEALYHRH